MGSTRRDSSLAVSCMFCLLEADGAPRGHARRGRQHRLLHPQGTTTARRPL